MPTVTEKAIIKNPGLAGTTPAEDPRQFARTYAAEETLKFGRAAMVGSDGNHAKVFAGAGASFAGVSAFTRTATGINEVDDLAGTIGQYEEEDLAGSVEAGFVTVFVEEAVTTLDEVRARHTQEAETSGHQEIQSLEGFVGSFVPEITAATYDLDVTIDAGGLLQLSFSILTTDDWDGVATKIQSALRTATGSTEDVAINADGSMQITSATTGASSTVVIAAGTAGSAGGDFLAAIEISKTTGEQSISSTPTTFVGSTVPGISDETYDLNIAVDTTTANPLSVSITSTDDWDAIAAALQVALRAVTGDNETVVISGGEIVIRSEKVGAGSSVRTTAGTAGSGGGDLLAAIDALAGYTTTVVDPVDGRTTAMSVSIGTAVDGLDDPEPLKEPGNFATTADPGRTSLLVGAQFAGETSGPGLVALLLEKPIQKIND